MKERKNKTIIEQARFLLGQPLLKKAPTHIKQESLKLAKILKEKGIEATIKLSESPNSKVIVIGSGKDGMPIILGNN